MFSCVKDSDIPTPTGIGYVNVYNVSPEAPSLDIYLNATKINSSSFDYSKYSGYLNFTSGSNILEFYKYNTTTKLVGTTINVKEGKPYTFFVYDSASQLKTWFLRDSSAVAAAGQSMVRFINLSPDAGEVSLKITSDTGSPIFAGKPFRSASQFIGIESKIYSFDLVDDATGTVLTTVDEINLASGGYYTILTRGFVSPPSGNTNQITFQVLTN
jgi:hypothetical protein